MSQGWISIDRAIRENPLWDVKPFSVGQAWIDLLLLANHKDGFIMSGGFSITIKRGQLLTTYRSLSKYWGWGHGRIDGFLKMLQQQQMIDYKKTARGTVITIRNYDKYQSKGGTD